MQGFILGSSVRREKSWIFFPSIYLVDLLRNLILSSSLILAAASKKKDLVLSELYLLYPLFIIPKQNDAFLQRKRVFFDQIGCDDCSTSTYS